MKIYQRKKELDWLNQVSSWSTVVGVSGLKGTGKSTFVKHWIHANNKRSKNFSFTRLTQLPEVLGTPELGLEASLDELSKTLSDYEDHKQIVIWDDIHHLSPKHINSLILFLKNQFSSTLHVIISDQSLDEYRIEIPLLQMQPFTETEIFEYLSDYLDLKKDFDIKKIAKLTGGFPFFVNIWAQSPDNLSSIQQKLFASLSKQEKNVLQFIYFCPRGLKKTETLPFDLGLIQELERKLYIEFKDDSWVLQTSLSELIVSIIDKSELERNSQLVLEYLQKDPSTDSFTVWFLALQARNILTVLNVVEKIEPQRLEGIPESDLKYIETYLDSFYAQGGLDLKVPAQCRMIRIYLHLLILIGKRSLALEKSLDLAKLILSLDEVTLETQRLAYDIIHWNHRSGVFEPIEKLLDKVSSRSTGELHFLFRLEHAFPFVEKNPLRALSTLDLLVTEAANHQVVLAHAYFQKARCHFFLQEYEKSSAAYKKAETNYRELKQIYFFLISRLNQLWIAIETKDAASFELLKKEVHELSHRYGYKYLHAGSLLAESQVERSEMRYGSSLEKIQQALDMLPASAPPKARTDILVEKVLTLSQLGLFQEAEKSLQEISDVKLQKNIRLQAQMQDQPFEDLTLEWKDIKSDYYLFYLLQHGQKIEIQEQTNLKKIKLGQWCLLEFQLTKSIEENNMDLVWTLTAQMEQILHSNSEISFERLALTCLQASLAAAAEKQKWLEKAELEMKRWGCDTTTKYPFEAWLESISNNKEITQIPRWQQSRMQDRERWSRWLLPANRSTAVGYQLYDLNGSKDISQIPEDLSGYQVVLIEHLGQVFFKSKELKEFHRKTVLRQMLALLLEIYPQSLTKSNLATTVWGEAYSPAIHDSRIYTSIQRLRQLIKDTAIVAWEGGYRWNPQFSFCYIKSMDTKTIGQHKVQTLILQALQNFKKNGKVWASRSELIDATGSSESTIKREITKLMTQGLVLRKGNGPTIVYSLR